jgi:DNA polymerase-1
MPTPDLILVDGSSYLYRAFHALPPLTNSRGEPTGAIYGVLNMLRKLLKDYNPRHIAVIFDAKGKTFRDDLYAAYKTQRPAMPDELKAQIEPLHTLVRALGLPLLMIDGVEADDVIGALAQQATAQGMHTLVSTGDKDLAQLVNAKVTLVNTMSNTLLDEAGVVAKFGVPPERMIEYLMLVGDSSDNIPGVPGVGPKTAAKWLQHYGDLDNLIAHLDEIKAKVGGNLRACLEQLPLVRQLVTVKCDLSLPVAPNELIRGEIQRDALLSWYKRLEFKSWLSELLADPATAAAAQNNADKKAYQIILTPQEFAQWLEQLNQAELFAFDTETTSLNYMSAELVGVSFALEAGKAAYVPLAHDYLGAPAQLNREWALQQLKPLLENPAKKKLGHNLKYDMSVLANYAITLRGLAFDSMLESYVLDSAGSRHDMDTLALKHLDYHTVHFADIAGKGAKQLTFNQIPLQQAGPYAAEDTDITLQLHQKFWPQLAEAAGLHYIFTEIEMPLVPVLSRMERHGVLIDAQLLQQQSAELAVRIKQLEQEAFRLAGQEFNLGSPKQLQAILYDQQGLPVLEKTPTGQPSTAESVLQELAHTYPIAKVILEYRSLSKLKSTYTDQLPLQIHPDTQRVHTSYHQAVTATGRLSSADPNLQNIPIRTEEGRRIRQAFIAPPGYKIIAADYSQIELRIMAHLSQDAGLLKAFLNGLDIHQATAAEVFGVALAEVTGDQRRSAKAINFGLIYGMSAFGLARQLGIERAAAQDYIDRYFARYPGVKNYMENTRRQAHKQGYVETLWGRRLNLPEINTRNLQRQRAAERAAINAPLQGTAADIIKKAMIALDAQLQQSQLAARMIMQVHDELVFEVGCDHVEAAMGIIRNCMTQTVAWETPLVVDIGVGANWDEAH